MTNLTKEKIYIPSSVSVKCQGWRIEISNIYKKLYIRFPVHTQFIHESSYLQIIIPKHESCISGCLLRKTKTLIKGIALKYVARLQFVGVGYRARIEQEKIIFRLGYSHEIKIDLPQNLGISIIKHNNIRIAGYNFEEVRQFAYKIRNFRKPEPFKGKGIICLGETIRRKEGKKKKL
jgi:large subunit ribosomal protein L6